MRRALVGVGVLVLVLVVVTGLFWAFQRRLVYLPQGAPGPVPAGAREVELTTADGLRLGGWFYEGDDGAPAVLVANGNGGHRGMRAPLARALHDAGLTVLLFDYRGYGGNPGDPTEEGLARDVRAARAFLLEETGAPLLYYGESLGAAVVTELAVEHPPAALVLRSPFTDLAAVGSHHYPFLPVRLLLRDRFPVAERIAGVRAPTVVVLGTADSIVPPAQSRAVADAAAGLDRLVEVPGADHNDAVLLDGPELVGAVVELAGQLD
ncbi:alpha/beta hydrolase [Geodermatophilus sp. SYSU D00691]